MWIHLFLTRGGVHEIRDFVKPVSKSNGRFFQPFTTCTGTPKFFHLPAWLWLNMCKIYFDIYLRTLIKSSSDANTNPGYFFMMMHRVSWNRIFRFRVGIWWTRYNTWNYLVLTLSDSNNKNRNSQKKNCDISHYYSSSCTKLSKWRTLLIQC